MLALNAGLDTTDDICAVGDRIFGIGGGLSASETLVEDSGVCTNLQVIYGLFVALS